MVMLATAAIAAISTFGLVITILTFGVVGLLLFLAGAGIAIALR